MRVRPTLRVELKHRVMKCEVPQTTKNDKNDQLNFQKLTDTVIDAMKKSKRANIGSKHDQVNLLESCKEEIS